MKISVFYLIFWIPFIQLFTCICSNICIDNQRLLLLAIKSNFEYNETQSKRLSTWNETSNCCLWNGVVCNTSGYVTGLDLSSETISGIRDDFGSLISLQFLRSLNLANNGFNSSQFPTGFGKLTGLTYLNLSNAGFSEQIPVEISRLVNLVTLDLSCGSYLSGICPLKLENPSLGTIIQNFTNLRGLYLNGVVISARGSEWCKALSNSVPNLQFLSLSSCNLSGGIDPSLEKLHLLSEIRLDQNNLADVVPDFFANFRNLTLLKLSYCNLNGTFPQKVLQLPTLRSLDLSYNYFLHGTLPEFPVGASLELLVLSYTIFSGKLPESVGNLSQLQHIELQNCSFNGSIPSSVGKINKLEYVDLSYNNFSGPIPSFSSAKRLICLRLSNNKLYGTLASTNWSSLSNLIDLDMSVNLLNGTIPEEMFSLNSLQTIQLFQNRFSGILPEMPNTPSMMLNTLDLSNNKLKGSVPRSLFGLKALRILKLSYNNFSGPLNLNVIQDLKNLSSLVLSFNSLSIEEHNTGANVTSFPQLSTLNLASCNLSVLPDFLKAQSRLHSLDLSINRISGMMPKWIWGVGNGSLTYLNLSCNNLTEVEQPLPDTSSLASFDIHGNKIRGEVPIVTSSHMIYLDYSSNDFTSISPNIGKYIKYTVFLSLSKNNIPHTIPQELCNATSLQVLDLSFNSLKGKIPSCIIEMTSKLQVLNLRKNTLTGTIVDKFPNECILSTLNVGENSLQGQIPRSLTNCNQLEVLDVRRNGLNDTFPHGLRTLTSLRVLVLRANNFHGSISCPDNSISWPYLQIMDIASNNFSGELEARCFSHFKALMATVDPTLLRVPILPLDNIYYQDMVVVTSKSQEISLQKILTVYKSIDISCNKFSGVIPITIGNLVSLIFLNLSNNALSGPIPSSIGNLSMLEALDLSHNDLSGRIPTQLVKLSFLSVLDLSYNKLTGEIPKGTQLQTFDSIAYIGNPGLCGPPLEVNCSSAHSSSETGSVQVRTENKEPGFEWQFILIGLGFGTGLAFVTAPLMFWRKGRKWYDKKVDKLVSAICCAGGIDQVSSDDVLEQVVVGHELFSFTSLSREDGIEGVEGTRFCLFCSKLDSWGRRVIHDPSCICPKSRSTTSLSEEVSLCD